LRPSTRPWKGYPVTIRLLDPPLHEFLPTEEEDIEAAGRRYGQDRGRDQGRVASLHEFNPMMGHRGCRLAVTYPEIAEMQTRAIIEAAINVKKKHPDWTSCPRS
jgi:pyruvate,orthophosphate dikinase